MAPQDELAPGVTRQDADNVVVVISDPVVSVLFPTLRHVLRYKWAYAALVAWVLVLVVVKPVSNRVFSPSSAGVPSADPTSTAPAVSTTAMAPTVDTGSPAVVGFAPPYDFGPTDETATPAPSPASPPAASPSGGASSPPANTAPATCKNEAALPAPVLSTATSAVATVQTTVTTLTGPLPADPAKSLRSNVCGSAAASVRGETWAGYAVPVLISLLVL